MEKEVRAFDPVDCELRATRRGRTIEGTGIVFNKLSNDLGGFREIIRPESIDGVIETSDILCLMNHDEARGVLARSTNGTGSMEVKKADIGVKCVFDAPETALGDEALSGVRRNDIRSMSFAFTIAEGGDSWAKQPDDTYLRTITKFDKIYDLSLVYRPAYSDTSVAVRKLVDVKVSDIENQKAEEKRIADLEEEQRAKPPSDSTKVPDEPAKDLTNYFKEIDNQIKKMKK